ncbi:MAG: HD domain-containing phosphohydrolase [Trueperaceae bacterium]
MIRLMSRGGEILYESPSVELVLGYEPGPRAAEHAFDRIHPDDVTRMKQELATAIEIGRYRATYRVRHANGEWRWIESTGVNLFDDPHVNALVLNSRDITDRKRAEEALHDERALSEAVINSFPGIFYVLSENGSHHQWNRNYSRLLGYKDDELARLHPIDLYEGDEKELIADRIKEVFVNGSARVEASIIAKDGRRIPMYLTGERVSMGGKSYLAGVGLDLSEIRTARSEIQTLNEDLKEQLDRSTALHEIDKTITRSLDLKLTLNVVLEQVTSRLQVDAACVLLYQPQSLTLRYAASRGFRGAARRREDLRLGEGLAGCAALEREPVLVDDAKAFATAFAHTPSIAHEGFESYLAVPLVAKGKLQGLLELFHRSALAPDDDWDDFLTALATQAAIALDNTTMFENLERSNHDLRLAYDTTIEGWARALDLKDEETEGHSRRVTELTVQLARRMGMHQEELVHVRRGALLHDIGKMGVPDSILLKPGKLDTEEWEAMKQHTSYALDLLSPIDFLRPALDIPYTHHEKWDGSGYPRGIKGDQIPLAARLFAVVDVYDALTSNRPYRPAWNEERALTFIREQAGTHFDPVVVEAFLELLQNVEA